MIDLNTLNQRPPDDLDVLLRTFFQSEMPNPWPKMKAPASRVAPRRSRVRSRLALAASVGFLMVGSWALSARLPEYSTEGISPVPSGVGTGQRPRFATPRDKANTTKPAAPGNQGTPNK